MPWLSAMLLTGVGLIHLLPLVGALGGDRLQMLYGIRVDDPSLAILLRHRAVLFGLVGGLLIAGAWYPPWRVLALVTGSVSVISFLLLAALEGGGNAALQRVVWIDWAALGALCIAGLVAGLYPD